MKARLFAGGGKLVSGSGGNRCSFQCRQIYRTPSLSVYVPPTFPGFLLFNQLAKSCHNDKRRRIQRYAVSSEDDERRGSLLPAGKRQARVQIPALFFVVSVDDITDNMSNIAEILAGGVTGIVLTVGNDGNAVKLYETALNLKDALRNRAVLLIEDRTDVADAIGADGTILSENGLPTVVAKNMTKDKSALVGRITPDKADVVQAAADGANFVVLQSRTSDIISIQDIIDARSRQRSGYSIPLIVSVDSKYSRENLEDLRRAGIDGLMINYHTINGMATALGWQEKEQSSSSMSIEYIKNFLKHLSGKYLTEESGAGEKKIDEESEGTFSGGSGEEPVVAQVSQLLSEKREEMVDMEKEIIESVIDYLKFSCPSLEEVTLLEEALIALDELFLLVVAGEFNSGKSAVINALLGGQVLAEGILPTTNEISVIKWANPDNDDMDTQVSVEPEQTLDGYYIRRIAADFLREVNIVDTPGTNVILDRQQRLTEEFIPRADLVLFVISADRPLTDSEVNFLKYIRQWGKKVLFVVNKIDLLTSEDEVKEVVDFVKVNASRLLGVDTPVVLPISARLASKSKIACRAIVHDNTVGSLTPAEQACLIENELWQISRFEALESFIRDFLIGGPEDSPSGERVRLKLNTPLFVANALLDAANKRLESELEVARADLDSLSLVREQLVAFRSEMEKEGKIQREEVARQVTSFARQSGRIIDKILKLSNWSTLSSYVLGPKGNGKLPVATSFQVEVSRDSLSSIKTLISEHSDWIATNCMVQEDNYRQFATNRMSHFGKIEEMMKMSDDALLEDAEARRRWRADRQDAVLQSVNKSVSNTSDISQEQKRGNAMKAAESLDIDRTESMLEQDVRDAVLGATSTAAGAAGVGAILTTILPNTLEDLLALALAGAIGYASVLNVPLKRAEVKKKLESSSAEIANEIANAMKSELDESVRACEFRILEIMKPLEELAAGEVTRIEKSLTKQKELVEVIETLQQRVYSIE